MTRRELLVNWARITLLRWRILRGRALPAIGMAFLRTLDRWASERAVDKPWTSAASARLDRILEREERER